jgi:hypothetical protein
MQTALPSFGGDSQNSPDLVLIDVNFDGDSGDPLMSHEVRPTGLLYGLCLLMWANVTNRPIGCAIHTGDASRWSNPEVKGETKELFVLLVGLVRAITHDGAVRDVLKKGEVTKAVEWLEEYSCEKGADHASIKAAEQFRKQLQWMADPKNVAASRLVVDPTNHVKLLDACDALGKLDDGTPVTGHDLLKKLGVLIHIDGKPDCFSVEGLFPNVDGGLVADDFRRPEPAASKKGGKKSKTPSTKPAPPESWRYDNTGGRPLVRAYLESLGQWHKVYDEAKKAANTFNGTKTPADLVKGNHQIVTRFVALAFAIMRLYKDAWLDWCNHWSEELLLSDCHDNRVVGPEALYVLLLNLYDAIKFINKEDKADVCAIADMLTTKFKWKNVTAINPHRGKSQQAVIDGRTKWEACVNELMTLLEEMELVKRYSSKDGDHWTAGNKKVTSVPPRQPKTRRRKAVNQAMLCVLAGKEGKPLDQIPRDIERPLGMSPGILGMMADDDPSADVPSWLVQLCEKFADEESFEWNGWPDFMRRSV